MQEQESRPEWNTTITSVSMSKHIRDLVDKYKLSPTEVFRRGVAVMVYELGEPTYNSELNKVRSGYSKILAEELKRLETIKEMIKDLQNTSKISENA